MMHRRRGLPYGNTIAAVFPALDPDGQIQYLQARYLDPGERPEVRQPRRRSRQQPAAGAGRRPSVPARPGLLVVCEGIPDALTAAGAGFRAAAVLGSQAPDHSVANRLAGFARRHEVELVAVVDNDPAGPGVGRTARRTARRRRCESAQVIEPPEPGMDLNAWGAVEPNWQSCCETPGISLTSTVE